MAFVTYLLGPEVSTLAGTSKEAIKARLEHLARERERTGKSVMRIIEEESDGQRKG
jgi:hypothetical protein